MISTEKEKARAKAITSQSDCCLTKEIISITRQNKLTITVRAFFSDKYLFILLEFKELTDAYKAI
jgi:hypothetical protein